MIGVVARHELGRMVRSAQSWVVAALFSALAAYLFLGQLERWIDAQDAIRLQDHAPGLAGFLGVNFLAPLAVVIAILAPLYAMKSFADDFRGNTWTLWQSAPVSLTALVLGRMLAVSCTMLFLVAIAALMVASLAPFTTLDLGVLASGAVGLSLCAISSTALGLYCSSLTRQPLIGAVGAIVLILLLWLLGSTGAASPWLAALAALSPGQHLAGFFQGYPGGGDLLYFLLFALLFLTLTVIRLDALRSSGQST